MTRNKMRKINKQPLVSVIMPVYNAGDFLRPAIKSILKQTYKNFELIIIDDASTDNSWAIIKDFKTKNPRKIITIKLKRNLNKGGDACANVGYRKAKGEFVARMDADDISDPKRLEKQVDYLLKNKDIFMVGTQAWVIDKKGEIIGIIGPNGSGKSTILKLIAGVMSPTSGKIKVQGKISPLIELGAGMHPELTGTENIYLNGAILGLKRKEIKANYKSIVDFAELWEFIDQPIKHYSSGMYMRLAFAIAIHVKPEILIVDEILAVGDSAFQEKCFKRMEEFKQSKELEKKIKEI